MVGPPITQLLTAQDYEDRGVRAMHAVLIELGQILGPYRDAVVVVGGAVPYLLLSGSDPPHVGTLDVDLDLDPEPLSKGVYAELVETLERVGYRRDVEGMKPFQLQRAVDLGDGGTPILVLVDLLMPRDAKTRRNRPALIAGLRVQGVDAGEIALKNNVRLAIDGNMPDGRPNRVELLVASIPALLVMKGFALDGRDKPKDAYDVYYCVRNFPGGPTALAAACRPLLGEPVVRDGYSRIAAKFHSEDAFGPHTVSHFLGESGGFENMSPEQVRVDAHRQVRAWLEALGLA
ncbi:MAG: hypothetical protein WBE92_01245 [Steroidobacteraceae bacterium]